MTQQPLWAPWRIEYVRQDNPSADCPLCIAASGEESTLVIARERSCLVMLNRFPYASGHVMVLPARHVGDFTLLDQAELLDAMRLVQRSVTVLAEVMSPDGFNVGVNLGQAAGAGIDEHLHWHVVPRWVGDTNFMPLLADTNVLPQALQATREELSARWPHGA